MYYDHFRKCIGCTGQEKNNKTIAISNDQDFLPSVCSAIHLGFLELLLCAKHSASEPVILVINCVINHVIPGMYVCKCACGIDCDGD